MSADEIVQGRQGECIANVRRGSSVGFLLTPALSLGEREDPVQSFCKSRRVDCRTRIRVSSDVIQLFPLPEGEGQGEGNGAVTLQLTPTTSGTNESRNPSTEALRFVLLL
jgi:hypothetical protein